VYEALNTLNFNPKHPAKRLEKLLRSAISNFEQKTGERAEDSDLYIREVVVDGGPILKRFRPAPQGRAYRIRKRSNHVTLIVDKRISPDTEVAENAAVEEEQAPTEAETKVEEPQTEQAEVIAEETQSGEAETKSEEPQTREVEATIEEQPGEIEEQEAKTEEQQTEGEEPETKEKSPKKKGLFGFGKKSKK